jgi:hypothetical protein
MTAKGNIANAVKAIMETGVPEADGRVYRTRIMPTDRRHWPCILVVVNGELVDTKAGIPGRRAQTRTAILSLFVVDDGKRDDLEDHLESLGDKIETALSADPFLAASGTARVSDLRLASTVAALSQQGSATLGVLRKDFEITYHTNEANPGQLLAR